MHTQQFRADHFLGWTKQIGFDQDPCLTQHDMQARNYLAACYAISLIQGETIKGRHIRCDMVHNYVKAAVKLHKDPNFPSPYAAPKYYINIVLKAVCKYEKEPDRFNMIDNEMIHYMEFIHS